MVSHREQINEKTTIECWEKVTANNAERIFAEVGASLEADVQGSGAVSNFEPSMPRPQKSQTPTTKKTRIGAWQALPDHLLRYVPERDIKVLEALRGKSVDRITRVTVDQVVEATGFTHNTVEAAIEDLEDMQIISRSPAPRVQGRNAGSDFHFLNLPMVLPVKWVEREVSRLKKEADIVNIAFERVLARRDAIQEELFLLAKFADPSVQIDVNVPRFIDPGVVTHLIEASASPEPVAFPDSAEMDSPDPLAGSDQMLFDSAALSTGEAECTEFDPPVGQANAVGAEGVVSASEPSDEEVKRFDGDLADGGR